MIKTIKAVLAILRMRGPRYFHYLACGWLLPRFVLRRRDGLPGRIAVRCSQRLPATQLRKRARAALPERPPPERFTRWTDFPVASNVRAAIEAARRERGDEPLLIGRIDDDGRLLGIYGPLPGFSAIGESEFAERKRFELDVVLWDNVLLVRKGYRGNVETFVREWAALALLADKVNVPALYHVDEPGTALYKNLVCGRTIRDLLVDSGAKILLDQTRNDPGLDSLDHGTRIKNVWKRGRDHLPKVVSAPIIARMAEHLERAHAAGVYGLSLTWGNVVIDSHTQAPWFIDLDKAFMLAPKSVVGRLLWRDRERELFNDLYGSSLMTESSARVALGKQSQKLGGYAPVDFGGGLTAGGFWTSDNGTGRWECVNRRVMDHLLPGRRVLDLGSNNGIMPVMMLRAGASEVVGVELDPENVKCARLVQQIFEWRDERRYALQMHVGNMLDVLTCDWGRFDIVTAFCSLYYLEPQEMAAVVRKIASLAPVLVLQAKTDTRADAPENKAEKSSLSFLKHLLAENGFPQIEEFAPKGFTRPLLIARVAAGGPDSRHAQRAACEATAKPV